MYFGWVGAREEGWDTGCYFVNRQRIKGGEAAFIPVNAPPGKLLTEFNIPSTLIFNGTTPPAAAPSHLKIRLEDIRRDILEVLKDDLAL
jgi:hypothetical protein